VTVFAASSLTDALGKLGEQVTAATGVPVKISFAASSIIARQIEAGAGAEVFVSADQEWMDYLEQRGFPLARALGTGRLATGDPDTVPLGIVYATDAQIDKRVRLVGLFPADSHTPITYPVALTARAGPDAARFVDYIRGDAGRAVFESFGFTVLP
jgi:molybdate transport system substrate-binding protein